MFVYVGCYTTAERNGHGEGISVYRIDCGSDNWKHVQLFKGLLNPSFLALDRHQRFLYSAHGDADYVSAFSIDRGTGELSLLNQQSTGGKNPVHLVTDPTNRFLIVANYGTGSVAALPIKPDGSLAPFSDLAILRDDPSIHRPQEGASHPHHVVFEPSGRFFAVPDKGRDRIFVYRLQPADGRLLANDPACATARPGAGPRHMAFHPTLPCAYVINELDCTITAYAFDAERGDFLPRRVVSTLPSTFTGENFTSEITVSRSGRFLYGSNRGHDSIVIFAIDQATATLECVAWEPTYGRTPRSFGLDPSGALLCVANQDSDAIVNFHVCEETGTLSRTREIVQTGSPASIAFLTRPSR